jgi:pyridoxine 4-dehydrogenase
MALSLAGRPPEDESLRILQHVLDQGIRFIDTADTYGLGPRDLHHNERLVARAIAHAAACGPPREPAVIVATKGGTLRTEQGWQIDGSPDRLYRAICASHEALGGERPIPLWQHHWPDPRYSIRAMLEPVRRAVDEGLVRYVGVSNYSLDQIKQAREVVEVVTVQNQYNLWHREAERNGTLAYCEEHDLVFLPWRPLGGLGLAHRLRAIPRVTDLARRRDVSPQRLMIAWHLAKSKCILPIPGSSRLEHLDDCLAAAELHLTDRELAELDTISEADLPRRLRAPAWEIRPPLSPDE